MSKSELQIDIDRMAREHVDDKTKILRSLVPRRGNNQRSKGQCETRNLKRRAKKAGTPLKQFAANENSVVARKWCDRKGILHAD